MTKYLINDLIDVSNWIRNILNIRAIWIFVIGKILFQFGAIITGLVMYSNLIDCDPFTAGMVKKHDQVSVLCMSLTLINF